MKIFRALAFLSVASFVASVACSSGSEGRSPSSSVTPDNTQAERGVYKTGKFDRAGSCVGACGADSEDGCYCDPSCIGWGDCCEDFAQVCPGEAAGEWTCDTPCTVAGDNCPPNEPYCNKSTGKCQQTPSECVKDDDCETGYFCQPNGTCYPVPHLNCRPGWYEFEGACDNAACNASSCPSGTEFDSEETCYCLAQEAAPTCERKSDCNPAWPYCNRETGRCQQEPPQCVDWQGCPEGQFCHSDGYCESVPELNCRPGWGQFEGECDNAACTAEACPEGTIFSESQCLCLPNCLYDY